jgi:hypothetical protein
LYCNVVRIKRVIIGRMFTLNVIRLISKIILVKQSHFDSGSGDHMGTVI